jgi:hypothetical protein
MPDAGVYGGILQGASKLRDRGLSGFLTASSGRGFGEAIACPRSAV